MGDGVRGRPAAVTSPNHLKSMILAGTVRYFSKKMPNMMEGSTKIALAVPGRGKWLGRVPAEPRGYYIWSSHFHGTVIKKRTLTKKISCLSSCRSEAISKKWSKVMEGLSKMKRQDCSGTIQGLIGQQNVANSLEGCSKMGVPGTHIIHPLCPLCRTCFRN